MTKLGQSAEQILRWSLESNLAARTRYEREIVDAENTLHSYRKALEHVKATCASLEAQLTNMASDATKPEPVPAWELHLLRRAYRNQERRRSES